MLVRQELSDGQYKAYCPIQIDGFATHALVDSGNSAGNAMSWTFARTLGLRKEDLEPDPQCPRVGTAKEEAHLQVLGRPKRKMTLRIGGLPVKFSTKPLIVRGLNMAFNISGPFMRKHGIDQFHSRQSLRIQGKFIPLMTAVTKDQVAEIAKIEPAESTSYVAQETVVPANAAAFLPLRVPAVEQGTVAPADGIFEAHQHFVSRTDAHPVLGAVSTVGKDGRGWTSVLNTTDSPITIPAGTRYGSYSKTTAPPDPGPSTKARATRSAAWYINEFKLNESPHLKDPAALRQAVRLLQEFDDLFSDNDEYGKTDQVEHAIHTEDVPPIKCRHRPLNPALEAGLRQQLDHWLDQDVIEPSSSPWSFPLVIVPKKNGSRRYCIDYRRLNQITLKDSFPLPNIEDNLARLANSKVFSGIDGTGAYHVVSIRRQDREKTAFSTPWGLFQFKQMPFGLCNAPATYCRLVQKVLAGIPLSVAIPYLDDTCIHSVDVTTHIEGLRRVLLAHRRAGLTLQPKKCQLFQDRIEYLGHNVSAAGISVPDRYTKIIEEWPEPQTLRDVRTFLGKVSYYRRFIPGFSGEASALTDLTKKEDESKEFVVTAAALAAFHKLKNLLSSSHILAYPQFDSEQPFIVDTDW